MNTDLRLEYDFFLQCEVTSHYSDLNILYNDPVMEQNDGYGIRVSLNFERKSKKINLVFGPYIRYWDIDKSETAILTLLGSPIVTVVEPANESTEVGLKVGIRF